MLKQNRDSDLDEPRDSDLEAALTALDSERKSSAGKDRKLGEAFSENAELKKKIEERTLAAEARAAEEAEKRDKLIGIAEALKAREDDLALKEKALHAAIEQRLPIALVMRGKDDLEQHIAELQSFAQDTVLANRPALGSPNYKPREGSKLTLGHLRRMSTRELSRIPPAVLHRLEQGEG